MKHTSLIPVGVKTLQDCLYTGEQYMYMYVGLVFFTCVQTTNNISM